MSNPSHMASTRCYLNHRYEASRAQFFRGFGFQAEAWETFAAALRERGQQNEVTLTKEAGFRPVTKWRANWPPRTVADRR
jgi:hypothetical protein